MITSTVKGDEKVIKRIKSVPDSIRSRLVTTVKRLSIDLQGYVVSQKLSGQVLHRVTGTLSRSIKWQVLDSEEGVVGVVGSRSNEKKALKYARIHEYGFNGPVTVKEHLRMQKMAWGKLMKNPHQVTVKEHIMHMHMPERSFLRTSLAENADNIKKQIDKAIGEGLKK